jgi:bifunctional UDP-N-acetylglucosamine pyrophosphorylase/glucosamine-1-phosphate N-acetyltransferase
MTLEIVILAAGQGSRMKSALPKVLHSLAGQSLLEYVLRCADALQPTRIHVVVGHQSERVSASVDNHLTRAEINWVHQHQQLGTGHAVAQALPHIKATSCVLIMAGDVPLIQPETLRPLCEIKTGVNLLTAMLPDASGFGRIIRDPETKAAVAIIEHKDASEQQRSIQEINTGIMAARADDLKSWLSQVKNENAQNEYYLPDIIALAVSENQAINTFVADDTVQVGGVNSRGDLAALERHYQRQLAERLMEEGVSLADPTRIDIRGKLSTGRDCQIDVNAIFEGNVTLGDRVTIGPNILIRNSNIGDDCKIEANSIVDGAHIKSSCQVGPFARIRPDTLLNNGAKIGNFVEIKKSEIGEGSKVNHLAYVGDSKLGRRVNIGAGVITCNYDGAYKHQTIIGDDVFVGSDCQLIAPVEIGAGATIGAGSTITRDAPAGKLSVSRARQIQLNNWQRPVKDQAK